MRFLTEMADTIVTEWQSAAFRKNIQLSVICEQSYHMSRMALCKKFNMPARLRKAMENYDALQMARAMTASRFCSCGCGRQGLF